MEIQPVESNAQLWGGGQVLTMGVVSYQIFGQPIRSFITKNRDIIPTTILYELL